MITTIPLDKAKFLAEELHHTVHAGTETATLLNDLIVIAEELTFPDIVIIPEVSRPALNIHTMFLFFDEVGMLDG